MYGLSSDHAPVLAGARAPASAAAASVDRDCDLAGLAVGEVRHRRGHLLQRVGGLGWDAQPASCDFCAQALQDRAVRRGHDRHSTRRQTAEPSAPAVGKSRPAGMCAMAPSSLTTVYSPKAPSPSTGLRTTPNTWSPTANRVAPGPRASTVPAKSLPSTTGKRCSIQSLMYPAATARSKPLTEDARPRTRTSPCPGSGIGRLVKLTGWPKSGRTAARIACPLFCK